MYNWPSLSSKTKLWYFPENTLAPQVLTSFRLYRSSLLCGLSRIFVSQELLRPRYTGQVTLGKVYLPYSGPILGEVVGQTT
jgi:hypothetical protein